MTLDPRGPSAPSSSHPQAVVVSQVKTSDTSPRDEAIVNICAQARNGVVEEVEGEFGNLF